MNSEFKKRFISSVFLIPLSIFIIFKGNYLFNFFIIICFLVSMYEWYNMNSKIYLKILGIIFLIFSFYSFYKVRNDFNGEYIYIFFILSVCISTDIGGYVVGNIFKGPKLTKISPKKTYSGLLGSYIFAFITSYVFIRILNINYNIEYNFEIFFYSFLISSVSQIGDIIISFFKRSLNIKDTGIIIPGHGGILDRIDGMIFAFPFCYLLLLLNLLNFIK